MSELKLLLYANDFRGVINGKKNLFIKKNGLMFFRHKYP